MKRNQLSLNRNKRSRPQMRQRYAWPNPLASEEQLQRFLGLDIEGMTSFERWQEIKQLECAITWLKDEEEILFYHPTRAITRLTWALERIKRLWLNGLR